MTFQIHALDYARFAKYFSFTDKELRDHQVVRQIVTESPGTPCRVSLQDARVGEEVILINYRHQPHTSPYQSSHAIFVRKHAKKAQLEPNDVPEFLRDRLLSIRAFNDHHMMIDADVVLGINLEECLGIMSQKKMASYVHLHFAKPGCFAAHVTLL